MGYCNSRKFTSLKPTLKDKQRCFPVGCVPPASVAISGAWGVWPGGVFLGGVCQGGGVSAGGGVWPEDECLPRRGVCLGGWGVCLGGGVSSWGVSAKGVGYLPGGGGFWPEGECLLRRGVCLGGWGVCLGGGVSTWMGVCLVGVSAQGECLSGGLSAWGCLRRGVST